MSRGQSEIIEWKVNISVNYKMEHNLLPTHMAMLIEMYLHHRAGQFY